MTITEDGFEHAGRSYASLSKIAWEITGAHWSGPRFFGLVRRAVPKAIGEVVPGSDELVTGIDDA